MSATEIDYDVAQKITMSLTEFGTCIDAALSRAYENTELARNGYTVVAYDIDVEPRINNKQWPVLCNITFYLERD